MVESEKHVPVTIQELLVSSLAQTDALAKLLIEKGIITKDEFMTKLSEERRRIINCLARRNADGLNGHAAAMAICSPSNARSS